MKMHDTKVFQNYHEPSDSICLTVANITKETYNSAVTELEAKARELWPEMFESKHIVGGIAMTFEQAEKLGLEKYVLVEREDGETDTLTLEEARRLDLKFREQQVPINSKTDKFNRNAGGVY